MRRPLPLLALALAFLVAPESPRAEPDEPFVVLGSGNRLSGRLPVLWVGPEDHETLASLRAFTAAVEGRCALRMPIRVVASLAGPPPAEPIVVRAGSPRHADVWARAVRMAIREGSTTVRHVPSPFTAIRPRLEGGCLSLDVETALPGRTEIEFLTVDGQIVHRGPEPLALDMLSAAETEVLVRLLFTGTDGLVGEERLWLPDLLPGRLPRIRIHGSVVARPGDDLLYHVVVEDADGSPLPGYRAIATRGEDTVDATTDGNGSATLRILAAASADPIEIRIERAKFRRVFRIPVEVRPAGRSLLLETDRPVYRPGGRVRMRALVVDASTRLAVADAPLELEIRDPRDRLVTCLEGRSDRFGAATFELPLARGIVEGDYAADLSCGKTVVAYAFRVEEIVRPELDVDVKLEATTVKPAGEIAGTIGVRTFDGAPLPGASLEVVANGTDGLEDWSREAAAATEHFRLPAANLGPGPATIRVVVSHGELFVVRELVVRVEGAAPVEPRTTGPRIEAPDVVAPGATIPVVVRDESGKNGEAAGVAHVRLVLGSRLLAAASVRMEDGKARADLVVPEDAVGPAALRIDAPGGHATRSIRLARPGLRLDVTTSATDARPGDDASLDVTVRDADGAPVPALLDLRVVDAAYRQVAGDLGLDAPAGLLSGERKPDDLLLVDDRSTHLWLSLDDRVVEACRPSLGRALVAVEAGKPFTETTPWGAPVLLSRAGRAAVIAAEPAVTWVRMRGGWRPASPSAAAWDVDGRALFPVRTLLPNPSEGIGVGPFARDATVDPSMDALAARQSPDGSFDEPGASALDSGDPALRQGRVALGLLAWLGAGHTHATGHYRAEVKAALRHLRDRQAGDGFIGRRTGPWATLEHAMATVAASEAYALTGSPLFKTLAQRAIDALAARQRPDGSFSETGWTEGSLVLTGWATMALKSAKEAGGIRVPTEAFEGIGRWIGGRIDARTGAVRPSAQEIREYPFPGTGLPRNAAGITATTLLFLGENPRDSEPIAAAIRTLAADLPEWDETRPESCDLHGLWWSTLATFQFGGDAWRSWNTALKAAIIDRQIRSGPHRGTWDPISGTMGRHVQTCFGSLCLEVYYRYSRVFGIGDGGPRVRREFPDLALADLARPTGDDGRARIDVTLADQITTWDVLVGAWDGRGRYARAERGVRSTLPLHVSMDLPARLVVGDRPRVPVRVRSTLGTAVTAEVRVAADEGIEVDGEATRTVEVPAGGMATVVLPVTAKAVGKGSLRVEVRAGEHADAVEHGCEIRPATTPIRTSVVVAPGRGASLEKRLPQDGGPFTALLVVHGGRKDLVDAGLRGLLRRPTGCFEQTSATLYPALLAYRLLDEAGLLDSPAAARSRDELRIGYQRLLTFEGPEGGFSLYPDRPVRTDLTALGVHLLLDLKAVIPIDGAVLRRAAGRLRIADPDESVAERIYRHAARRRAGVETDDADLVRRVLAGGDTHLVALAAVHGLVPGAERDRALRRLTDGAIERGDGVRWPATSEALFSGRPANDVETTALATHALARLGGPADMIGRGLETLRAARLPDGAWRTTRETVVTLRALLLATPEASVARGTLTVRGAGGEDRVLRLAGDSSREEVDLGTWDRTATLDLAFDGEGSPWVTLVVTGPGAEDLDREGPIGLFVDWPESIAPGKTASVPVSVVTTDRAVHYPTVSIPIPAGLVVDRDGLLDAVNEMGADHVVVRDGRVEIYFESLAAEQEREMALPVRAHISGRYRTGGARAWPYYDPARVTVVPDRGLAVEESR